MFTSHFIKLSEMARACALAVVVLSAAVPVRAQHDHHGAPAPPPKPSQQKKKPAVGSQRSSQSDEMPAATPTPAASPRPPHDAHTGHGLPQSQPAPSIEQAPAQTLPAQTENVPASPASAPSSHDHTAAPATGATPAAAGATPLTGNVPSTEAPATGSSAPAAPDHSIHGAATGSGESHGTAGPPAQNFGGSLVVMSDAGMGIRVGASASNVMPMGQMGSGTAWQPATTPMYMWHKQAGEWLLMFHGEAKIGINHQGGPRGVTKFESQNWFMPMAYRRVGRGTLQLRGMFSFEPFTFSGAGSPQLFQTGEVFRGEPIIDAQHPHDLVMELSAQYTMPLGERGTWFAYFGYPGEPALGPVAFMHRASASENPSAPLTHHLQDSTHISFGVLTTGLTYRWFKLEGSVFNGREPDEQRYGFEANPWNSRSARLSFAPDQNWALQVSYGLLKEPEQLEPGDTRRMTASIQYNRPLARGNWASALIWGRNREAHDGEVFKLNGYTAESTLNFLDKNYLYTRLELVDKKELLRHADLHRLGFEDDVHPQFRIGAYTFGYARDIWNTDKLSLAVGGDATIYSKPDALDAIYGRHPVSSKFFIRIRPGKMSMSDHSNHNTGATHSGHGVN